MRAEHDAEASIFVMAGLRPGHPRLPWAMKQDVDPRDKRGHDDKFQSSPFRDAPLGADAESITPAAMCCPHPEERAFARVSKDGNEGARGHPSSFETRRSFSSGRASRGPVGRSSG